MEAERDGCWQQMRTGTLESIHYIWSRKPFQECSVNSPFLTHEINFLTFNTVILAFKPEPGYQPLQMERV